MPVSATVSVPAVLLMLKWMPPMSPLAPAWPEIESASEGLRSFSTNVALVRLLLSTSVIARLGAIVTGAELAAGVPFGGSVNPVMAPKVTTGASLTGVTWTVEVEVLLSRLPSLTVIADGAVEPRTDCRSS